MENDCIGEEVVKLVVELPNEGVLLNEKVRFYKEEEMNAPEFTNKVASLVDTYANDAFGTAHRAHASTNGVAKFLKPYVAGFVMQKELDYLVGAVANPLSHVYELCIKKLQISVVARASSRYLPRLSEFLGVEVKMENDCIGEKVVKLVVEIPNEGVLLNENVRFYKEEDKNDPELTRKVASLADTYANDTFGTAHRAHASTNGVAKFLKPYVAGFLTQKELDYLGGAVANPKKPFAAIVGSSKVSTKIGVIESLLAKVDALLIGREMLVTFYKAQGNSFGSSLVEEDKLDLATSLLKKATAKRVSSLLPTDVIIVDKFDDDGNCKVVPASQIVGSGMGLDT
ncbi:hypothetical protein REPUB_Repub02eG0036600 [Reevesia pubescens]